MERALKSLLIALSLLLLLSTPAFASTILLNSPAWNTTDLVHDWGGNDGSSTYGQTIKAPTNGDNVLKSFTFYIFSSSPAINFNAYVQAWDGTSTTGSPLFTGAGSTLTAGVFNPYTFNTNLALTAGATYLLYFSTLGVANPAQNIFSFGATAGNTYADGKFVFNNIGFPDHAAHPVSELNNAPASGFPWFDGAANGLCCRVDDLAFQAVFEGPQTAPVPEPATMALLGTGISALVARRRRAKK